MRALAGGVNYDSGKGTPTAWLIGIARRVMVASLETGRVEDQARKQLGMAALILGSDAMARVDELAAANGALDRLPHDQRCAVVGRVLEDQSALSAWPDPTHCTPAGRETLPADFFQERVAELGPGHKRFNNHGLRPQTNLTGACHCCRRDA
jgi:hypothetical protein